ncbi:hypothetical protein BU25DRAFT_345212, partial [Macroventuria anomochaeta]
LNTLPPVFQDSVTLCHRLSIKDLWIDALCLTQDDSVDRESEIGRMGNIHCHTFCNFSAIAAAELSVGLFVDKDPWLHTAFPVSAESEKQRFELCGYSSSFLKDIDRTALQKRDWVLQERLLSPRTVFFGDQLSWGCMESRANETFPGGLPSYTPGPGNFNSFKLDNLFYRLWRTVINRHTQCDLTFENDVFPALSGLARIFKEFLEVTYLVGLWKGSLYANLIWKRSCNPYLKSGRGPVQTATYRGLLTCTVQATYVC